MVAAFLAAMVPAQAQTQTVDGIEQAWRAWMVKNGKKNAVRLGAIDVNMVVYVQPALGKGPAHGELDRGLSEAARAVRTWP